MMSATLLRSQTRFLRVPEICAGIATGIALLALVGWLSGTRFLAGQWGTYIPMAPSTALAFFLLATALFCFARLPGLRLSRLFCLIAASIVSLLSLLVLAQFITGIDLGVEQVLSRTNELLGSTPLGRMSPLSAVAFLFESVALFLLIAKRWRHAATTAALLAAAATGMNAVILIGYAYGAPLLYGGTMIPVALPAALAFVLVGLGQFNLAAPGVPALRKWNGASMRGILLRAFLPFILFFVLVQGWFDLTIQPDLSLNPAVWQSLMALIASLLSIAVIGWIARRTGKEIERAQQKLAESEEHYRLLFENSGEAILFTQPDGTIYSANPEACRIFGMSEDEIIKVGRGGIVDSNDPRLQVLLEERRRTGKFKGELNLLRQDGTIFPGEVSSIDFKDSHGNERTSVMFRDLSERKQTEKRLIESEAKFRNVFEHSPLGKSLTGVDGTLSVNKAFSDIVGYSEEELRTKKWKAITHPDDIQVNLDAMQSLLDNKISRAHFEKRYIHKNGNFVWVDVITVLERDESGNPLYFLTTISDITERKHAEESLQRSLGQITHGRNTLQALSLAAQAAQRSHTPQAIYQAMGNEIKKLGLEMMIFDLDAEKREMSVGFMTYAKGLVRTAEKLIGLSAKTYRIPVVVGGYYDQVLSAGKAVLFADPTKITAEILPAPLRPLSRQLLNLLGARQGIYATLVVEDQPQGILIVMGSELGEADLPAIDILTAQVSIALENARLFQAVQLELVERKRVDDALRESEKRFRALIENSADAITLLDANGIAIYDSPAAPGMLGYDPGELIGQNAFALIHPDDLSKVRDLFQKLVETPGARVTYIFRVRHKKGTWLWIEAVATNLLAEPGVNAIVLNYRDITARIEAEEVLRENEERYRLLVETLPDGVVVHSQGRIVFANLASTAIIGAASPADLTGKLVIDFVHPDYRELVLKRIQQSLSAGVPVPLVEEKFVRLDGTPVDVEVTAIPFSYAGQPAMLTVFNDIGGRKRTEEKMQRQLQNLFALSEIDRAISSSFDLQFSLATLLVHVIAQLGVDAADVLLFDSASLTLEYTAGQGFRKQAIENVPIELSRGHAARAILYQRLVHVPDLKRQPDDSLRSALFVSEDFVSYYAVPLLVKGELNGVLEVFQRSLLEPDQEWLDFLNTLAGQAAIAIDNATLFNGLQRSNVELTLAYDATIEGWSRALDLRDKETEGHTQRVTEITMKLVRAFGLSEAEMAQVRWGALLHDIGKMGVPDGILLKPGPLTDEEWVVMKKHPTFAYEMLAPIRYLRLALDIPYCHHEKWDGTGYPRGLKDEQIPLPARIFAVVDVWDALRSDRPYRKAWDEKKVREHIRSLSGTHFDPHVVSAFLPLMEQTLHHARK